MASIRIICESIHLAALGVWTGALLTVGAMAAIAFPTLRDLDPTLSWFAAYDEPHWPIAAGAVMDRAFAFVDWVGVAAGAVALATLALAIGLGGERLSRVPTMLRSIVLVVVAALTAWTMLVLRPDMNHELYSFWAAARAGDLALAATHQAAFDAAHPTATLLLIAQFMFVLLALAAGAIGALSWAAAQPSGAET